MTTNRKKQLLRNIYVKYALILLAGLFLGWLMFSGGSSNNNHATADHHDHDHDHGEEETVWTCSMHPQIRMDEPGLCPLCAMDLIPLQSNGSGDASIDPDAIQMSNEAIALANIQTTRVDRQNPVKDVRLYGTIQVDERLSQSQTSHVSGRIEKLSVNFTGENVKQGQVIATIYSPEILTAQQELIEAAKVQDIEPSLLQAVRQKLQLWKLSDEQIARIEQSGEITPHIDITANTSGIVVSKNINQGDYISPGTVLFDIANLSQVWAVFDAYESDLPFLKKGDKLEYTLQSLPSKTFSGTISFINPILDPVTRTAKIRVETSNPRGELMPEMYASAIVSAQLKQYNNEVVIPKTAILWTGKRSIVYVKQQNTETPAFMLREVELGPSLGDSYVILSGISDGDEIVTNGAYMVDASAQLAGKQSMMNETAGSAATGHEGHNMQSTTGGEHVMFYVGGSCEMCKDRIEKAAKAVDGVLGAVWVQSEQELHLDFNPEKTSADEVAKTIAAVGHDTDKFKADDSVYNALPACCFYRD